MRNLFFVILFLFITSCALQNKGREINLHKVDGVKNVAVKGYDVVSYFKEPRMGKVKPSKGTKDISYNFQDVTYFFENTQNLNRFKSSPEKYMPQYGGYCAYGVSVPQQKIDIEPTAWKIHEGKLYLNYTKRTQEIWLEDIEGHIEDANENWPEVKIQ